MADAAASQGSTTVIAARHLAVVPSRLGAADLLCLAAAPTFALVAVLSGVLGHGGGDMVCSAIQDASPLSGMVLMYWLMSAFHLAPWLRLVSNLRSGVRQS